jgi:hypothetical protein
MNRDQIIAKTIEDMWRVDSHGEEAHQQSAQAVEYDRSIAIPELVRRLPDGEILTCAEFDFPVECCGTCHGYYPHYDMYVVELPDGRNSWICCAIRRALFHEPESQEVDLEEALGGGLRKRKDPSQE